MESQLLFTPGALLSFLSQVEELQDYNLDIQETSSKSLQITIGNSVYTIRPEDLTEIPAKDVDVEDVFDASKEALNSVDDLEDSEPIESGILKEMAKSLMLGGMIRLSTKLLK